MSNMAQEMYTTYETVAEVRSQQAVVPLWMKEAFAGLADSDIVEVTRTYAVGRRYVRRIKHVVACPVGELAGGGNNTHYHYPHEGVEVEWHVEGDVRYVGGVAEVCPQCAQSGVSL